MRKKFISLSLIVVIAFGMTLLSGCNEKKSDESSSKKDTEFTKAQAELDKSMAPLPKKKNGEKLGVILSSLSNEFWQTNKKGAEATAKEYGVKIDIQATDNDTDFAGQLNIMNMMISKDYDAIAVSPLSENNLINGVVAANKSGVKVILSGTTLNKDALKLAGAHIDCQLKMDFHEQGVQAGKFVAKKKKNKGKVAIIAGTEGATQSDGRRDGAKEVFESKGMEVVAVQQCDFDQQKAYDATKSIMQAHPDIVGITCGNDDMAMGVIKALKELKLKKKVVVVGNDFTSQAKASIKKGELDASVAMSPYLGGRRTVLAMLKASQGQDVSTLDSSIPIILVSKDNISKMEDWK